MRPALGLLSLAALLAAGAWAATVPRVPFPSGAAVAEEGDPERGRLVFAAGDCASCHASPGQPDRLLLGGGLALASPFGTFRVPNISPDPNDGIGRWSTTDLGNALISGVSPSGKHYYPALPYTSFTHMTLGDVSDLMAYLRTLRPVTGRAPPHELSPVFRIRRAIGLWKMVFFSQGPSPESASQGSELQRGRY